VINNNYSLTIFSIALATSLKSAQGGQACGYAFSIVPPTLNVLLGNPLFHWQAKRCAFAGSRQPDVRSLLRETNPIEWSAGMVEKTFAPVVIHRNISEFSGRSY